MSDAVLKATEEVATLAIAVEAPVAAVVASQPAAQLVVSLDGSPVTTLAVMQDVSQLVVAPEPAPAALTIQRDVARLVSGDALLLDAAGSDNKLSRADKKTAVPILNGLLGEAASLVAEAATLGVSSTAYAAAVSALSAYLATLTTPTAWNDTSGKTNIDGATWSSRIGAVYTERGLLNALLHDKASKLSTWSGVTGSGKPEDGADVTATHKALAVLVDTSAPSTNTTPASYRALGVGRYVARKTASAVGITSTETSGVLLTDVPTVANPAADSTNGGRIHQRFTSDDGKMWKRKATPSDGIWNAWYPVFEGENTTSLNDIAPTEYANFLAAYTDLIDSSSDGVIGRGEKKPFIRQIDTITNEQASLDAQATAMGVTTEKTAYDSAISTLTSYLATLTTPVLWSSKSGKTTVNSTTLANNLNAVWSARAALLAKLAAVAGATSTWSGVTGSGKPTDNADVTGANLSKGTAVDTSAPTVNSLPSTYRSLGPGTYAALKQASSIGVTSTETYGNLTTHVPAAAGTGRVKQKFESDDGTTWKRTGQPADGAWNAWRQDRDTTNTASLADVDATANIKLGGIAAGATVGATWGVNVGSRPTELTDGRVAAGLDASGDLARDISDARKTSSNILKRTGGGTFAGELDATKGARAGTNLTKADGTTTLGDADVVTSQGTAAAITGQGALATKGSVDLATSDVANKKITNLKRDDGTTAVTEAAVVTGLGVASGITGQGALATKGSVDLTTGDVANKSLANLDSTANTKLGGIEASATVGAKAGTNLKKADGTTTLSDADIVTSSGTAAAIAGQGALATKGSVDLGSADVTNKKVTNLKRADGTTDVAEADIVTSLGTASAIAGQGALATKSQVTASLIKSRDLGANLNADPEFDDTTFWSMGAWAQTPLSPSGGTVNAIGFIGAAQVASASGSGKGSGVTSSITSTFIGVEPSASYRFVMGTWLGSGFTGRVRLVVNWYNAAGSLISSSNVLVGTDYRTVAKSGQSGEKLSGVAQAPSTAAYATLQPQVNWSSTLTNNGSVWVGGLKMQRAMPLGSGVVRADDLTPVTDALAITSLGTAAAIVGQGPLATKSAADTADIAPGAISNISSNSRATTFFPAAYGAGSDASHRVFDVNFASSGHVLVMGSFTAGNRPDEVDATQLDVAIIVDASGAMSDRTTLFGNAVYSTIIQQLPGTQHPCAFITDLTLTAGTHNYRLYIFDNAGLGEPFVNPLASFTIIDLKR